MFEHARPKKKHTNTIGIETASLRVCRWYTRVPVLVIFTAEQQLQQQSANDHST